jgi:hypothetical protein
VATPLIIFSVVAGVGVGTGAGVGVVDDGVTTGVDGVVGVGVGAGTGVGVGVGVGVGTGAGVGVGVVETGVEVDFRRCDFETAASCESLSTGIAIIVGATYGEEYF